MQRLVLASLAATVALPAQEYASDGALMGLPFACLVSNVRGGRTPQQIYSKKTGFIGVTARTSPAAGPDFSFTKLFRNRGTGTVNPGFEIDAFSVGLDELHIEDCGGCSTHGVITPTPPAWVDITFTIQGGSSGPTATGAVRREDLRADQAGTDVFGLAIGLGTFPLAGRRELDGRESDLSDGSTPAGQITSLDVHVTAWDLDSGIVSKLPARPRVFFSVPTAALPTVPSNWWNSSTPSGATILFTEWNGSDWTLPQPRVLPPRLRLQNSDEVDALAVEYDYVGSSGATRIVFSTLPGQAANQLMYVDVTGTDPGDDPAAVKTGSSTTATDSAGAGAANVVGVCFSDPSGRAVELCDETLIWAWVLGTPLGIGGGAAFPTAVAPRLLESSMLRDCPGGTVAPRCTMAGWTASGRAAGMAVHLIAVENAITGGLSPWFVNATRSRPSGTTTFEGDPIHEFVRLPSWLHTPDSTRCVYLWSTWIAINGAELAQSWPIRIRL